MKTILIPIFHGHIARNILRTDVLKFLATAPNVRVVLVVPDFKRDLYEKEFGRENVIVVASPKIQYSKLERRFRSLYYFFIDTETVRIIQQEQFWITKKYVRYWYARFMTLLLGHIRLLRQLVRFLDEYFVKDTLFTKIFDEQKPDVVFIPSITSDDEGLVFRQARARNIPVVAMIRSWDNITVNKGNMRLMPEKLLVHSTIMKPETAHFADIPEERIEVVGMSHFDYYTNDARIPREEFFRKVGGNSSMKTVYFMPIGLSDQAQDKEMLGFMENILKTEPRLKNTQLMLSAHPNTDKQIDYAAPGTIVIKFPGVIHYPGGKLTDREITKEDMELMASAIYHADLVVNYQGTTSLDAAAFDKPVINIAFDEAPNKPYLKSVRRFYDFTHYLPLMRSGGVKIAWTKEELSGLMADYIEHPEQDRQNRRVMLEEQGGVCGGKASEQTANAILSLLANSPR